MKVPPTVELSIFELANAVCDIKGACMVDDLNKITTAVRTGRLTGTFEEKEFILDVCRQAVLNQEEVA